MKPVFRFLQTFAALALAAGAQTVPLTQNALSNKDVVTLARAGFNEDFIIETIAMSRTRFDTSIAGLTELAHEGLTERIIHCMMAASPPPTTIAASAAAPGAVTEQAAIFPVEPERRPAKSKTYVIKPSATRQALAAQTPFYESTSILWGLWRKRVGVGSGSRTEQVAAPPLGGFFNQVRLPLTGASPAASQQPYYEMPARYVVLP